MICNPINKKTTRAVLTRLKKSKGLTDMTEIWFDQINDLTDANLKKIFQYKKPILYKWTGDQKTLERVLQHNLAYIDLDISTPKTTINKIKKLAPKTKIIISFHDFKKTPTKAQLNALVKKMTKKGADIVKLATLAKKFKDSLVMLSLLSDLTEKSQKAICICMGANGTITRSAGHLFGNYLMYAPIDKADKTASGQLTAREIKEIRKLLN